MSVSKRSRLVGIGAAPARTLVVVAAASTSAPGMREILCRPSPWLSISRHVAPPTDWNAIHLHEFRKSITDLTSADLYLSTTAVHVSCASFRDVAVHACVDGVGRFPGEIRRK